MNRDCWASKLWLNSALIDQPLSNRIRLMLKERESISYCISGMQAREQIVFKSLMRLLAPRLAHAWIYMPKGELAVVGNPPNLAQGQSLQSHHLMIDDAQTSLSVGGNANNSMHHLRLPIQANVMEVQLNAIGAEIAAVRMTGVRQASSVQSRQIMETQPQALPMPEAFPTELPLTTEFAGKLSLKRWPAQDILRGAGRIRMATILLRPSTTMKDFLSLSVQPPELCLEFLHELRASEFLRIEQQVVDPMLAPAVAQAALKLPALTPASASPSGSL